MDSDHFMTELHINVVYYINHFVSMPIEQIGVKTWRSSNKKIISYTQGAKYNLLCLSRGRKIAYSFPGKTKENYLIIYYYVL